MLMCCRFAVFETVNCDCWSPCTGLPWSSRTVTSSTTMLVLTRMDGVAGVLSLSRDDRGEAYRPQQPTWVEARGPWQPAS